MTTPALRALCMTLLPAIIATLSLLIACQPPQPNVESRRSEPAPSNTTDSDPTPSPPTPMAWTEQEVFAKTLRVSSLQSAQYDDQVAFAFDTPTGDVYLLTSPTPQRIAQRAHLGCLGWGIHQGQPVLHMITLEREQQRPNATPTWHRLALDGRPMAPPWRVEAPVLWADPGARCGLFNLQGDTPQLLIRAREARAEAPLDLWWITWQGASRALNTGPSIPLIGDVIATDNGGLVTLATVQPVDDTKRILWQLLHFDAHGHAVPLGYQPQGVSARLGLGREDKTLIAAQLLEGEHDTHRLASILVPTTQFKTLETAPLRRTLFDQHVDPAQPPQMRLIDGQWWAILLADPGEHPPGMTWLLPAREGRATALTLPETLRFTRVHQVADALVAVGVGEVDDKRPDLGRSLRWAVRAPQPD